MQESMVNQPSASRTAPRRTMSAVGGVLVVPFRPSGPPPPDVPFSIGTAALSLIFSCPSPFSRAFVFISLFLSVSLCLSLSLSLSLLALIWPFVCMCFLKPPTPFPLLSFDAHAVLFASSWAPFHRTAIQQVFRGGQGSAGQPPRPRELTIHVVQRRE